MVTRFIKNNKEVWDAILDHIRRTRAGDRAVAIAYCHDLDLLPLGRRDVLVCDASEHAIKSAQTNAFTLKKLIKDRKVHVYSLEGLHAKVVLAGNHAIVGSMNASANSRDRLLEAAIVSDDVATVRAAEEWIEELCGEADRIKLRQVNALCKLPVKRSTYVPPKRKKKAPQKPIGSSGDWFYLYSLERDWSVSFARVAKRRLLRLRRDYSEDRDSIYDAIECNGIVPKKISIGAKFFLGHSPYRKRKPEVYRDCQIVDILPDRTGFFYRYPKHEKTATWDVFAQRLRNGGRSFKTGFEEGPVHPALAQRILRDWGELVADGSLRAPS